jgi:hypothetical protein
LLSTAEEDLKVATVLAEDFSVAWEIIAVAGILFPEQETVDRAAQRISEVRAQAREAGVTWMLESIRAPVAAFPHQSGDIQVMESIQGLIDSAREAAGRELEAFQASYTAEKEARYKAEKERDEARAERDRAIKREGEQRLSDAKYYTAILDKEKTAAEARLREVEDALADERACHDCKEFRVMMATKLRTAEGQLVELRAALEEYRLRCSGWTFYAGPSPVHPGVPRAADDSWEVHTRNVEALLARTETPKA